MVPRTLPVPVSVLCRLRAVCLLLLLLMLPPLLCRTVTCCTPWLTAVAADGDGGRGGGCGGGGDGSESEGMKSADSRCSCQENLGVVHTHGARRGGFFQRCREPLFSNRLFILPLAILSFVTIFHKIAFVTDNIDKDVNAEKTKEPCGLRRKRLTRRKRSQTQRKTRDMTPA